MRPLIGLTCLGEVFPASAQVVAPAAETAIAACTNLRYFLPYTADGLATNLIDVVTTWT
jgi:hypothetical protein